MRRREFLALGALGLGAAMTARGARARPIIDPIWSEVFARMPPALAAVAHDPAHAVQVRWLRGLHAADGRPYGAAHDWDMTPRRWFPAASVVKLPMALLMAEAVQAAGGDAASVLRLHAPPISGAWADKPRGETLDESFARGLARTFAVSDNVPFNRWFELLGGDAIHRRLAALGYPHVRLIARIGSSDIDANRRSGGGRLLSSNGDLLRDFAPAVAAARRFPFGAARLGEGWRNDDGSVTPGPHDFSRANFLPLADALRMLQAFLRPESVPATQRWRIDDPLRGSLLRALSLRPRDSIDPVYDEAEHPDGHARWFFVGDGKTRYPDGLTVFGKSGMAYGSLSEVAWVVDRASGREFMLAASIRVNADGIYNDDRYEYDGIGLPFMAALGRAVLDVERRRSPGGGRA